MNRRQFLHRSWTTGTSLLAVPALSVLSGAFGVACNDPNGETGSSGGGSVTYTVDDTGGHSHSFQIPLDTLQNPPAAGFAASTSTVLGHAHSISLTQAELIDINASMNVSGDTTLASGHLHTFTFPT